MACAVIKNGEDGVIFVCGKHDIKPCKRCGFLADYLCDWPVDGGTCDAALCRSHAANIGEQYDLCPIHAKIYRRQSVGEIREPGNLKLVK